MADEALFIGWGEIVSGREGKAVDVFNESVQYYGELHWARAWPVLVERVGTNAHGLYSFPPVAGARTNVSGAVTGP